MSSRKVNYIDYNNVKVGQSINIEYYKPNNKGEPDDVVEGKILYKNVQSICLVLYDSLADKVIEKEIGLKGIKIKRARIFKPVSELMDDYIKRNKNKTISVSDGIKQSYEKYKNKFRIVTELKHGIVLKRNEMMIDIRANESKIIVKTKYIGYPFPVTKLNGFVKFDKGTGEYNYYLPEVGGKSSDLIDPTSYNKNFFEDVQKIFDGELNNVFNDRQRFKSCGLIVKSRINMTLDKKLKGNYTKDVWIGTEFTITNKEMFIRNSNKFCSLIMRMHGN